MKYSVGNKYVIKRNVVNDKLDGNVFRCYMVGDLNDGTQMVWGEFNNPIEIEGKVYTTLKLHEDDMICRKVNA